MNRSDQQQHQKMREKRRGIGFEIVAGMEVANIVETLRGQCDRTPTTLEKENHLTIIKRYISVNVFFKINRK